jgi:hypothetical protein
MVHEISSTQWVLRYFKTIFLKIINQILLKNWKKAEK